MFRYARLLLSALVLFAAIPAVAYGSAGANKATLDTSQLDKGTIGIRLAYKPSVNTKAKISKGSASYIYTLTPEAKGQTTWLPLQMGNGQYEVAVLENVSGTKYRVLSSEKIDVAVARTTDVYLNSTQNIGWKDAEEALAKAKELTRNATTDEEKAKAVYEYIVQNVSYDKELARKVTADYLPDIDETLASGQAICYGYATLYAAMLRSAGIPTKLAMGTSTHVAEYHAWNEVYLNGKWVVVDTTVDAGLGKNKKNAAFAKKGSDYTAIKYY
ncbi:transglutaminase-like domain-containing protein [Cohnella hongkongensis]|uniref:Transglutaminase family protein n=1 Tax=Cohnella hongkongensis TaxID=178337 RepID=A0ABV9FBX1_9BACL